MTLYRMVNGISNWQNLLLSIPRCEDLIRSGKLINKLPQAQFVPNKVFKIIKKACKADPRERFHSASEMRNSIEKLKFYYNWKLSDTDYWCGSATGHPNKDIYLEAKRNSVNVVVLNNGRRSSQDSGQFTDLFAARSYLLDYIRETTLQ